MWCGGAGDRRPLPAESHAFQQVTLARHVAASSDKFVDGAATPPQRDPRALFTPPKAPPQRPGWRAALVASCRGVAAA